MDRAKGSWAADTEMDPDAALTWNQINAQIDKILAEPRPRRHRFSGLSAGEAKPEETITILPHGARRIKVHWPDKEVNE